MRTIVILRLHSIALQFDFVGDVSLLFDITQQVPEIFFKFF
jgi:hypothetical protein